MGPDLVPDTAVILSGRLSIREEEDPKLLLDKVEPLPPNGEHPSAPAGTLWLRLPDGDAVAPVSGVLERYPGTSEVILYLSHEKQKLRAPAKLRVLLCDALLSALTDMLGDGSVVVK